MMRPLEPTRHGLLAESSIVVKLIVTIWNVSGQQNVDQPRELMGNNHHRLVIPLEALLLEELLHLCPIGTSCGLCSFYKKGFERDQPMGTFR